MCDETFIRMEKGNVWRDARKNDRDEIVWPEVHKNGKGAITFGDVFGTGEKDGVRRDAPFLGELEE